MCRDNTLSDAHGFVFDQILMDVLLVSAGSAWCHWASSKSVMPVNISQDQIETSKGEWNLKTRHLDGRFNVPTLAVFWQYIMSIQPASLADMLYSSRTTVVLNTPEIISAQPAGHNVVKEALFPIFCMNVVFVNLPRLPSASPPLLARSRVGTETWHDHRSHTVLRHHQNTLSRFFGVIKLTRISYLPTTQSTIIGAARAAGIVIVATTRNASLHSDQKQYGLELAKI